MTFQRFQSAICWVLAVSFALLGFLAVYAGVAGAAGVWEALSYVLPLLSFAFFISPGFPYWEVSNKRMIPIVRFCAALLLAIYCL